MADTLGGLIDKLNTVDFKMWHNQELFYSIRKMSYDEFKIAYLLDENKSVELYETFKKVIDINLQRNQLIDEIDEKIIQIIKDALSGKDIDDGKNIQRKHKSY